MNQYTRLIQGKPCVRSRQLKVDEMAGHAGAKRTEAARERSAGAVYDDIGQKSTVQKTPNFYPPRNDRAG